MGRALRRTLGGPIAAAADAQIGRMRPRTGPSDAGLVAVEWLRTAPLARRVRRSGSSRCRQTQADRRWPCADLAPLEMVAARGRGGPFRDLAAAIGTVAGSGCASAACRRHALPWSDEFWAELPWSD